MILDKFYFVKCDRNSVFEKLGNLKWNEIATLLDGWKEGTVGYATFHKEGKSKSPEQLGYYYGKILPMAVEVFQGNGEIDVTIKVKTKTVILPMSKESVDLFLKKNYGGWKGEFKHKGDMNMAECSAFEDWAILWLAKWLDCHVPPADTNWRQKQD